ncbi:hypothetical protein FOXG_22912 [Fusarium oxysporum f. sp. lycopersici 4287]|uniref:Uncharacterized protein n=1 Tax=Fusarium oxysporum f. sp. lycopersici (strain 4287 / CBS 123668 / FGSC 9935 / NRRL 34936) TaxID=426428 RepID=A0A0J9WCW4_FUSO4|nr:uncharacterized protein FOXG_22912 [Fusarium oxysporum f. sp. lycopersici 4287]KNB20728.1 hypothetical protein FOXG_22912 [Fusarium oxysporum f. sp. lycopersici 4287]
MTWPLVPGRVALRMVLQYHACQIDLLPQHVDQITSRSRFQEEGSEKNSTLMLTLIDDRDELRKKRQPKQRKKMTGEV